MDNELLQRTRYQLQQRVRALRQCPPQLVPAEARRFLAWVAATPSVAAQPAFLEARSAHWRSRLEFHLADADEIGPLEPEDDRDHAALGLALVQVLAKISWSPGSEDHRGLKFAGLLPALLMHEHVTAISLASAAKHGAEAFRETALRYIADYFDEAVDGRNSTLGVIRKFKVAAELFRRSRLRALAQRHPEGTTGERALALDLYEHLHEEGLQFHVEPSRGRGRPDLVAQLDYASRLMLADVKYLPAGMSPGEALRTVTQGLRQVRTYVTGAGETAGYLVVFIEGQFHLAVDDADEVDGWTSLALPGARVFIETIDISDWDGGASKRPPGRSIHLSAAAVDRSDSDIEVPKDSIPTARGEASG